MIIRLAVLLSVLFFFPLKSWSGLIRVGDVLEIQVLTGKTAFAQLSGQFLVADGGTLDYPLYQDKSVLNMTTGELMNALTLELSKSLEEPFVIISQVKNFSMQIKILGHVKKPGFIQIPKGGSLQEVLALAGGTTEFANLRRIKLIRESKGSRHEEFIDFYQFMSTGDLSILPEIRNGDIYIVGAEKRMKKVKVLGAIKSPGLYNAPYSGNLFDMIQMAGGPVENADLSRVRHVSLSSGKPVESIVNIQKFLDDFDSSEKIPEISEGDIIIIKKHLVTWRGFMTGLRDVMIVLSAYLFFQSINS